MILYGVNPVTEALLSDKTSVGRVYITRGKAGPRLQNVIDLARQRGVPVHFEPAEGLSRKAGTPRHQDVVAELTEASYRDLDGLLAEKPPLLVLADGVEDPRNLGAMIRTAEACGAGGLLLPDRHTCGLTPTVVKASSGAALHLPVARIGNVVQALDRLKKEGYWTVGLDMRGAASLDELDPALPLVVVVGGEDRGIRRLVAERCDYLVALPMRGKVSSLNLSVAAGILLFQIAERRARVGRPARPSFPS